MRRNEIKRASTREEKQNKTEMKERGREQHGSNDRLCCMVG